MIGSLHCLLLLWLVGAVTLELIWKPVWDKFVYLKGHSMPFFSAFVNTKGSDVEVMVRAEGIPRDV